MVKKIKLPLEMANGVTVRTIEELKENWDLEKIVFYYNNGRLLTWLNDRYYSEQAQQLKMLQTVTDSQEMQKQLCSIFEMPFSENVSVNVDAVAVKNEKLDKLRKLTSDDDILKNVDKVAFDQEELADLLDKNTPVIYLANNTFTIPFTVKNKKYIGIGAVTAVINSKKPIDFDELCIRFEHVKFDKNYDKIVAANSLLTELQTAENLFCAGDFSKAFTIFLKLAENNNNGRAMFYLGEYYRNGYGNVVPVDADTGFKWHRQGEKNGDVLAGLNVAYSYPDGSEERNNVIKKFFNSVKELADSNDPVAQNEIACVYKNGYGIEVNKEMAVKYYKMSAQSGYVQAAVNLGHLYFKDDYAEAVKWYRKAAEQGYADAQNYLGKMYYNGQGTTQDYTEAVKWYRKAAEQGHADAQNSLAHMYYNGNGVEQNYEEALKWHKKAADLGDINSLDWIAFFYYKGYGVQQNYSTAIEWWKKGVEAGNANCAKWLGDLYKDGEGVEQNYEDAVKWYHKAAEQGSSSAQNMLGMMYSNGNGVQQNDEEAVKWWEIAAEQGQDNAENNLGWAYENGRGVNKNYEKAVEWYRKSAEQGNTRAQRSLGWLYQNGRGVPQDDTIAASWYLKAAEKGYATAQNDMGFMYQFGRGVQMNYAEAEKWYRKAVAQGNDTAQNNLNNLQQIINSKNTTKAPDIHPIDDILGILDDIFG